VANASESSTEQELRDATEVKFSLRAMLIVTAILAVSLSALSAFIRHFPATVQPELVVLWALLAAFLIGLFAYHARRRYVAEQQAGHVLFSLVPHSYFIPRAPDVARLICGGLLFAVGPGLWIAYSFTIAQDPNGGTFPVAPYLIYGLIGSSLGLTCLWWRRMRIGEDGLVVRSKFVPWDKCFRWYWDACYKNVVVVNCEPRMHLAMIVPAEDRAAITALLAEKIVQRTVIDRLHRMRRRK
jgi:hypothetical protein